MAEIIAFDSSVTEKLAGKVDKVTGKGLSTEDYTTAEKTKLAGIDAGAQKNPDLTPYAKKTEVSAKRDKADNIAAKDEAQFTEWKFHCDVPEIQAALDANPPELQYDGGGVWDALISIPLKAGDWWVTEILPDEGGGDTVALSFPITGYHDVNGDHLSNAVTATRKKDVITKSGEPYVTPTGVKALAPKTELHALAPEAADTEVVLKPLDDKANYVTEKVEMAVEDDGWEIDFSVALESLENGELSWDSYTAKYGEDATIIHDGEEFVLVWERDISLPRCVLNKGRYRYTYGASPSANRLSFDEFCLDGFVHFTDASWMYMSYSVDCTRSEPRVGTLLVDAPPATNHARQFTLTLETDADEEKDVTWQGGEVVEAFPGAKKLAIGRTTWDVKEVAPDVFVVDRVPGADSVSLTGANGNAYTLGVDENGVLEVVKEDE